MADKTCINIHFDSLGWTLSKDPAAFHDPSFFDIADRFFAVSGKYGFKYTIFVIGRDLGNPDVAARVKAWAENGHEIGNHSYGHKLNFGSLNYNELETEVMKSHEMIANVCGKEPRGFAAPGWSSSDNLTDILRKNGYLYDTSVFPSYFMWIASVKAWWNFRGDDRRGAILQRKDRLTNLFADRKPYISKGLLEIPLPVTAFLRIPCWHTMSFLLPKSCFEATLRSCLKLEYFSYVLHPADLIDSNDVKDAKNIERLNVSLEDKMSRLCGSIETIIKRSGEIVTLEEIARGVMDGKSA
ncbi:MAG: polysaccharide deacetylase family protein [Candidatus Omnitrophota bacterium]|nr:polysaccharide deacetylase family protein [Candidatus Omnitrophota bacterium]